MKKTIKRIVAVVMVAVMLAVTVVDSALPVMADTARGLTVAPMNEKIIVNPGESFQSSFKVSNPVDSKDDMEYELSIEPFYTKAGGEFVFEKDEIDEEHTLMADWIKFDVPTKGKLEPNETKDVQYTISVPSTAPAGGQYAMVAVSTAVNKDSSGSSSSKGNNSNASVNEIKRMAHLIYAEVTGNTIKRGDIYDMNVPSFLLDGNIKGSATIKNNGNVHGDAKYSLQVFPLFSNEEVYTNEENSESRTILPNRDYYVEVAWEDTPMMGFYNVVFKVEFEGETQEIKKVVIKMPIWMIFLIVFIIAFLIIWITLRVKGKGKKQARASSTSSTNEE